MKMKTYLLLLVLFLLCISFPAAVGQEVENTLSDTGGNEVITAASAAENSAEDSAEGRFLKFGHLPQDSDQTSKSVIWRVLLSDDSDNMALIVTKDRFPFSVKSNSDGKSAELTGPDVLNVVNGIFGDDEKQFIVESKIFFLPANETDDDSGLADSDYQELLQRDYDECRVEIGEDKSTNIICPDETFTDVYPALWLQNAYLEKNPDAIVEGGSSDTETAGLLMVTDTQGIEPENMEPGDSSDAASEATIENSTDAAAAATDGSPDVISEINDENTHTPEPTAAEDPTATPEPTATEIPTATPEPTAAEDPTATPEPTAAEIPTPTPAPGIGEWLGKHWLIIAVGVVLLAGAGVGIYVIGGRGNNGGNGYKDDHKDGPYEDDSDDDYPPEPKGPDGPPDPPVEPTLKSVPTTTTISRPGVYHCSSCIGQGKRNYQEDDRWYSEKDPVGPVVFAVIADGMGGMENGKESSALAIEIISSRVNQYLQSGANVDDIPAFLRQMAIDANAAIYEMNSSQGMNGGATLICTLVIKNWLYWINIGDSRIYLYRDGMLAAISEEHELENRMYNGMISGEIDLYDIREMQYRELRKLTSNLGRNSVTIIDQNFIPYRLHQGDKLLLCSDGISGSLTESEIIECMQDLDPNANCNCLQEKVEQLNKPGQDNYSAIVVACATEDGNEN